jgi:hypothetical protein
MNLYKKAAWKCRPFIDGPTFYTNNPPCWIHRLLQRCFFGFRWSRE